MANIKYTNCVEKGRGYSFSLFPLFSVSKTNWKGYTEHDIGIGLWFWYVEINWIKRK